MRTVFVPYVLLSQNQDSLLPEEVDDERERREAGNEERTVVLCVEVENPGESGPRAGFVVESVDVIIGGEGASATLIGWGDGGFAKEVEKRVFPLLVGSMEQYNLLYAVSFLRSPEDADGFTLTSRGNGDKPGGGLTGNLQRAVTINIKGKPFMESLISKSDVDPFSYPAQEFSSRWNCILDLSAPHSHGTFDPHDSTSALPEPASPFPAFSPRTPHPFAPPGSAHFRANSPQPPALAGSKRHTLPGNSVAGRSIKLSVNPNRASTSMLNLGQQSSREHTPLPPPPNPLPLIASNVSSHSSYIPPLPSTSVHTMTSRSPTTYGPPPTLDGDKVNNVAPSDRDHVPPLTPAYPAYPPNTVIPPTPLSQAPIANIQAGSVGPSMEVRRERGVGLGIGSTAPQTPGPLVVSAHVEDRMCGMKEGRDTVVVSIGLLPLSKSKRESDLVLEVPAAGPGKIYPYDKFTMDIFVFNQSSWTRRFEVSCPDQRRRRHGEWTGRYCSGIEAHGMKDKGGPAVGMVPLDNRIRVG